MDGPVSEATKFSKLNHLLDQTSMYSKFLAEKIPDKHKHFTEEEDRPKKKQKKVDEVADDHNINSLISGGFSLRPYQLHGVDWLISLYENGLNGILADEMGLGKTLQLISFIAYLRSKQVYGPFIVAAPLSTLHSWVSEFKRFTPGVPVLLYHGSKDERQTMRDEWSKPGDSNFPVIITSFELCLNDKAFLSRINWKVLAVDEGHRLKNMECKLIKTLKEYNSENRLLLTGTPLQNNLKELWSLLNFLLPDIFDSLERFESWFNFDENCILDTQVQETIVQQEREHQVISKLHEILRPFVLRRIKSEALAGQLPDKVEFVVYCPLTAQQKSFYQAILDGKAKEFFGKTHAGGGLKNMLMQLRKVCNHPYLLREPEDDNGELTTDERIVEWCGKMKLLDVMLTKLKKNGHKVLIFSQMTNFLNVLEDYLVHRGLTYCRIDGAVEAKDRQRQILHFNKTEDCFCFLLSTRAGGLGINLTAADTVIIYDSDWNPHQDDQAQDRCHRIGQTREVRVYRFITPNSVEVNMLRRANSKRKLDQLVIAKGNFTGKAKKKQANTLASISEELQEMFNFGETHKGESTENDLRACYEDGILCSKTLNAIMTRGLTPPAKSGVSEGFQSVQKNTTFADLF